MDQIKIGRFISETRKAHSLTQPQLADALAISDKTVSKWQCGKGLPEASLMLSLCDALHITVNDLLSSQSVSEVEYQKKAEENMTDLMKENQENKKAMVLSVICGMITIIAACALVMNAALLDLPAAARIARILFAAATGIGAACVLEIKAGHFEYPSCKALFVPTTADYVKGYHPLTRRRLTCPKCGKAGMCRHRITR